MGSPPSVEVCKVLGRPVLGLSVCSVPGLLFLGLGLSCRTLGLPLGLGVMFNGCGILRGESMGHVVACSVVGRPLRGAGFGTTSELSGVQVRNLRGLESASGESDLHKRPLLGLEALSGESSGVLLKSRVARIRLCLRE